MCQITKGEKIRAWFGAGWGRGAGGRVLFVGLYGGRLWKLTPLAVRSWKQCLRALKELYARVGLSEFQSNIFFSYVQSYCSRKRHHAPYLCSCAVSCWYCAQISYSSFSPLLAPPPPNTHTHKLTHTHTMSINNNEQTQTGANAEC